MTLQPFTVDVGQTTLDDLAQRLARTRWPGELDGPGWEDGTSPAFLRELVGWWQNGFDWRAQEAAINRFPQFRATVDEVGDAALRERIILAYLGLADRIASRYRHSHETTFEDLTQTARAGLIAAVVADLPELERQVIVMRFFQELSQDAIAARIGYSQVQVSRLLRRALARLRAQLVEP